MRCYLKNHANQILKSQLVLVIDRVAGMETQPALDMIRHVSGDFTSIDSLVQVLPREPQPVDI